MTMNETKFSQDFWFRQISGQHDRYTDVRHGAAMHFLVYMREGVKMYIENPTQGVEEKAQKAFDKYMGISFEQKLLGTILVADGENGILAEYFENFR
jgi:hypothetical protein